MATEDFRNLDSKLNRPGEYYPANWNLLEAFDLARRSFSFTPGFSPLIRTSDGSMNRFNGIDISEQSNIPSPRSGLFIEPMMRQVCHCRFNGFSVDVMLSLVCG